MRSNFHKTSLALIVSISLLFCLGLLMVFNTTAAEVIDRSLNMSTHAALGKQALYGAVGVAAGMCVYRIGYINILKWSGPLLVLVSILLVAVFIPSVGQTINGARRWIGIAGITFQPSEAAKILLPLWFIQWMVKQRELTELKPFLKALAVLAIPLLLIFVEPDNGTTVIIFLSLAVLFLLARIKWTYWALPLLVFACVGITAALNMPHVPNRIQIYLHPELDLKGKGHQPYQAKIAAGSGQWTGRGLGESLQKLNYLPEARSDYIAAIYAEECGFIGILGLIALYMVITCSGFLIAMRASTREAFLLASILTFLISIQAFLNLGIVSGLLPSKGMTLPFFSQGGSSLIMNMIAFFLLLDIRRRAKI